MHASSPTITEHRLARLIAWTRLALCWMAALFYGAASPRQRHIRQREALSLDVMARMVRYLVIIRAARIARMDERPHGAPRDFAPRGFHRRMRRSGMARSCAGSWLRRTLRHPNPARRFAALWNALGDLDTLARTLLRRMRGGLRRLRPLIAARPPGDHAHNLAAPAACAADTS